MNRRIFCGLIWLPLFWLFHRPERRPPTGKPRVNRDGPAEPRDPRTRIVTDSGRAGYYSFSVPEGDPTGIRQYVEIYNDTGNMIYEGQLVSHDRI